MLTKRDRLELMGSTFGERLIGSRSVFGLRSYLEDEKTVKMSLIPIHILWK